VYVCGPFTSLSFLLILRLRFVGVQYTFVFVSKPVQATVCGDSEISVKQSSQICYSMSQTGHRATFANEFI
jgi:hypothetical protein